MAQTKQSMKTNDGGINGSIDNNWLTNMDWYRQLMKNQYSSNCSRFSGRWFKRGDVIEHFYHDDVTFFT